MSVFYYNTLSLFGSNEDLDAAILFFRLAKIAYDERNVYLFPLIGNRLFKHAMHKVELYVLGYYPIICYQTKWMPNTDDIHFMSEYLNLVIVQDYHADKHDIRHKLVFTPGKCVQFAELKDADQRGIAIDMNTECFLFNSEIFDSRQAVYDYILFQKIRKETLKSL